MSVALNMIRPLQALLPDSGRNIALIILNRPLDIPLLTHFWKKSLFTAVADGAANRLMKHFEGQKDAYIPDIITGDFDSASPTCLDFYRKKGVEIVPTPDQDETDFTKCLRIVTQRVNTRQVEQIIAIGAFSGRVDHTLANINTLYTASKLINIPTVLVYDGSLACLLDKGEHVLKCDTGLEGEWCGLIPVGQPADRVTTTGLKYNLDKNSMRFGGCVSTSNTLSDSTVTVSTDQPLLWVMGYKDL